MRDDFDAVVADRFKVLDQVNAGQPAAAHAEIGAVLDSIRIERG